MYVLAACNKKCGGGGGCCCRHRCCIYSCASEHKVMTILKVSNRNRSYSFVKSVPSDAAVQLKNSFFFVQRRNTISNMNQEFLKIHTLHECVSKLFVIYFWLNRFIRCKHGILVLLLELCKKKQK